MVFYSENTVKLSVEKRLCSIVHVHHHSLLQTHSRGRDEFEWLFL
jgi:hypothetical protein